MNLKIKILVLVLASVFFFGNSPKHSKAIVPVFDAALTTLLTGTQATIIGNQVVQISALNAIATAQAGQYQKEIGIPPPSLLPYYPSTIAASAVTCTNLDCFAWILAKVAVHTLSQEIITWIRKGNFNEGPLMVTDWENFLLSAVDQASGAFLQELSLTQLCQPFSLQLRIGLSNGVVGNGGRGIPFNQRARCTVSGVLNNLQNFYNNFSSGGWQTWMQVSQEPANNPYMAFLMGIESLENRRQIATQKNFFEALASQGLLGQKDCGPATIETESGDAPLGQKCTIVTPGKAVQEQLSQALGANMEQLNLADEIDEILMALLQTLLKNLLTGGILGGDLGQTAPIPTPITLPTGGVLPTPVSAKPLVITSPANKSGFSSGPISVTAESTVIDISSVQFLMNGTELASVTGSGSFNTIIDASALAEGAYTLIATGFNASSTQLAKSDPITFAIDRILPVINGLRVGAADRNRVSGPVNFFATASDNGSKRAEDVTVEFFLETTVLPITKTNIGVGNLQAGEQRLQAWDSRSFVDGVYQLTARATDKAGNTATTPPLQITINN